MESLHDNLDCWRHDQTQLYTGPEGAVQKREGFYVKEFINNISEIFIRCEVNRQTLKDSGRNSMMSITTQRDLALNDVNASAHLQ